MRVAAIYDIHGNLPALEAVVRELEVAGVDRVVVGGDALPGPMPTETLAVLRELPAPADFVIGNGERDVLALLDGEAGPPVPEPVREAMLWVGDQLGPGDVDWLRSWKETVRLEVAGLGAVLFCHATPVSDREIFTKDTPEDRLLPTFDPVGAPLVLCGHTHMQFDRRVGSTRVVNAGSVGMPFGEPGAYWALLGPEVELRRTPFDLEVAADRVRATAYPQAGDFARGNVLAPPAEADVLELFEASALR